MARVRRSTCGWERGADAEPERVTTAGGFDGFPKFSPDGTCFVFASNRATAAGESDSTLSVARWVP